MRFEATSLPGVWQLLPERHGDERGFFARTYCRRELAEHGVELPVAQASVSHNHRRGTLRGLHYQVAPHGETKLVSCIQGAVWDVAVDVRPGSPTCGRHVAVELSAAAGNQLLIPEGFAHGFLTLGDDAVVAYQISTLYAPEAAAGFRWDDPEVAIPWPRAPALIGERDRGLPPFAERRWV